MNEQHASMGSRPWAKLHVMLFALLLAAHLALQGAQAQGLLPGSSNGAESAEQKASAAQPDPYGRETPRSLVSGLLAAFAAGDYERAAQFLEPTDDQKAAGRSASAQLARRLQHRLDNGGSLFPFAKLSREPAGENDDGLPLDEERLGSLKTQAGEIPLIARRITPAGAAPYWVVSARSLKAVAQQAPEAQAPSLTAALPDALNETRLGGAPLADWLVLLVLAALLVFGLRFVFGVVERIIRAFVSDPETSKAYKFAQAAFPPTSLYLAVIALFVVTSKMQLAIVARQTLVRYAGIVAWIAFAWFLWRLIDTGSAVWSARMARGDRRRAMSALVFARRTAKTLLVIVAFIAVLDTVGVDVTTGIAALGIGGLALALGAQKTIENLVGSVTVIADQPVRVGDFCKVGDVLGTVEDIGMRSTRIRTLARTVITIPNAAFSSQEIENYSRRDRFLFNPVIRLPHDTSPDSMRSVLASIRALLAADKNVLDDARVRFVDIGAHSLDIEILAYFQTFDYAISLEMREQVLLGIMDVISAEGATIALPSQTIALKQESSGPSPRPALLNRRSLPASSGRQTQ